VEDFIEFFIQKGRERYIYKKKTYFGKYVHMKQSIIIKLLVLFFSKQNSNESLGLKV